MKLLFDENLVWLRDWRYTTRDVEGLLRGEAIRIAEFAADPELGILVLSQTSGVEMKYLVIFEKTSTGYSAYVPDLPGCITTGPTLAETERLIKEAIDFHIDGLREEGLPIPAPTTAADSITAA